MAGASFDGRAYDRIRAGCQASAAVVVPLLLRWFTPRTALDVGGGEGWFALQLADRGVDVAVVDRERPDDAAPVDRIVADLARPLEALLALNHVDLALCLEVAEHLPEAAADALVEGLVRAADVVAFSAAVPGQGGHGHLNEQWPDYWTVRFNTHGYLGSGAFRHELWDDERVEPWYRQNLVVYCAPDAVPADLVDEFETVPLALVHPRIFGWRVQDVQELSGRLGEAQAALEACEAAGAPQGPRGGTW